MKHWYVMHSKPKKEKFLFEQLCLHRIEAYCPAVQTKPVNPRTQKLKPYFPGYLFVNIDLEQQGTSILQWMPGALGLVSYGDEPASIPDELLRSIRRNVEQVNLGDSALFQKLKPGDKLTIQSGPFAGYRAIFDSHLKGSDRVRVLLQMLKDRQVCLELSGGQVEGIQ